MVDGFHKFLILSAMNSIVFDEHEHISPTMVLIFLHGFVVGLQLSELRDIVFFQFDSIVLVLIGDFFAEIIEEHPICTNSLLQVLQDDL